MLDYWLDLIFPNLNDSMILGISVMSVSVFFSPGFPNSGNRERKSRFVGKKKIKNTHIGINIWLLQFWGFFKIRVHSVL